MLVLAQSIVSDQVILRHTSASTPSPSSVLLGQQTCFNPPSLARPNLVGPPSPPIHSIHRPSPLPIPQKHPLASASVLSTDSSATSSRASDSRLHSSSTSRQKRRKLRSSRTAPSLSHDSSTNPDGLESDVECDLAPIPNQRLVLHPIQIPVPPPLPSDFVLGPQQQLISSETPWIESSVRLVKHQTFESHTCIRTKINSHSVSLSTQPPSYFSKPAPKPVTRLNQTLLSSAPATKESSPVSSPTSDLRSIEVKRNEEQNKWWHWCKNCKYTGDGNKSSHLVPLRCKNLGYETEDHSRQDIFDHSWNSALLPKTKIMTKIYCPNTIENQKFYCSLAEPCSNHHVKDQIDAEANESIKNDHEDEELRQQSSMDQDVPV